MRIISGSAKGRPIVAPDGTDVRPTTDRVREAVFNALFSAGALDDVEVVNAVDVFAGTGALGLEALSRGIRHVTFVERSRSAIGAIEKNLAAFGFADRATIVRGDALAWLETVPQTQPLTSTDIVFCDPPYGFEDWSRLLELVRSQLSPRFVVVESDSAVDLGGAWAEFKTGRYASTVVQIARPGGASMDDDSGGA